MRVSPSCGGVVRAGRQLVLDIQAIQHVSETARGELVSDSRKEHEIRQVFYEKYTNGQVHYFVAIYDFGSFVASHSLRGQMP